MWRVFAALQMEYERALCISLERTRPHKYFLGNNGFYWNPETGEISLDPGKNVPQSMQLPQSLPVFVGLSLLISLWLCRSV